jgi:hypothetical protein
MAPVKTEIVPCPPQGATLAYRLSDDQLDLVLAALPSMVANAPLAWHRTRRKWIIKEIAALHPTNAVQAAFASEVVVLRHTAASLTGLADPRTTSPEQARRLNQGAYALTRMGERLERTLRRRQTNAVPPGDTWAAGGFDLLAMEALWRNNRGDESPPACAAQQPAAPEPAAGLDPVGL